MLFSPSSTTLVVTRVTFALGYGLDIRNRRAHPGAPKRLISSHG